MLALILMDTFSERFGMTDVGAASEAGMVVGFNEKSLRTWRNDFYKNGGEFSESHKGLAFSVFSSKMSAEKRRWVKRKRQMSRVESMLAAKARKSSTVTVQPEAEEHNTSEDASDNTQPTFSAFLSFEFTITSRLFIQ